jgi:hypothetical protein
LGAEPPLGPEPLLGPEPPLGPEGAKPPCCLGVDQRA